ncbi:MAG: hypothetical protein AB7K68_02980 [Bacteriovoracia bacterium]
MKTNLRRNMALLLVLALFGAQSANAEGTAGSGGGGAFVCRDGQREIQSAELVDLWEANHVYGEQVVYSQDSYLEQITKAMGRLHMVHGAFAEQVQKNLEIVLQNMISLQSGVSLTPPRDALPAFQKPGCPLEGMMQFDDRTNKLYVDATVYSRLSTPTDKAAAMMHEAIYKTLRDLPGQTDSIATRKLVGKLFGNQPIQRAEDVLPALGVRRCTNAKLDFFLFDFKENGEPLTKLVFTRIRASAFPAGAEMTVRPQPGMNMKCPEGELAHPGFADLGIPQYWLQAFCVNKDKSYVPKFGQVGSLYGDDSWADVGEVQCVDYRK